MYEQVEFVPSTTQYPPPDRISQEELLPVLEKMLSAYKFWHKLLPHTPKTARYTLCEKVDSLFVATLENIVIATHTSDTEKSKALSEAITKLDLLKFFLRVGWEIQAIANKKYITLSEDLDEVGRMLGGWLKHTNKNSRQ